MATEKTKKRVIVNENIGAFGVQFGRICINSKKILPKKLIRVRITLK